MVETLLMWFGFCLPYNLHSVHLLWVKTVNYNKIQELCTVSSSKDQHKRHTLSPFSDPDMITRPNAKAWKTWCSLYGTLMLTLKRPLDQLPKHFSMCVRAQTDPSHLWVMHLRPSLHLLVKQNTCERRNGRRVQFNNLRKNSHLTQDFSGILNCCEFIWLDSYPFMSWNVVLIWKDNSFSSLHSFKGHSVSTQPEVPGSKCSFWSFLFWWKT